MALERARIVVFQGRSGDWYWRRQARNGRITAQSEGYVKRATAERQAVKNFPDHAIVIEPTRERVRTRSTV